MIEALSRIPDRIDDHCLDREADIYEFFVEAKEHPFVIRVVKIAGLIDTHGSLRTLMSTSPVAGNAGGRPQQPAREERFTSPGFIDVTENLPAVRSIVWVMACL